jgi:LysM repeat protein
MSKVGVEDVDSKNKGVEHNNHNHDDWVDLGNNLCPENIKQLGELHDYVVVKNDSLNKLSYMCGTSVKTLKNLNNLAIDTLIPG